MNHHVWRYERTGRPRYGDVVLKIILQNIADVLIKRIILCIAFLS